VKISVSFVSQERAQRAALVLDAMAAYHAESEGRRQMPDRWLLSLQVFSYLLQAAPLDASDQYVPFCNGTLPTPRTSRPGATRPHGGGHPRNRRAEGANVTIPCGMSVILDLPSLHLTVLFVQGVLRIKDDPSLPSVSLAASFIIVGGRFIAGTSEKQFSQKAVFTLLPQPQRQSGVPYRRERHRQTPQNPRDLGHKAFAVVGGQVDLHGLPGRPAC